MLAMKRRETKREEPSLIVVIEEFHRRNDRFFYTLSLFLNTQVLLFYLESCQVKEDNFCFIRTQMWTLIL
jgi:hypothetical protein